MIGVSWFVYDELASALGEHYQRAEHRIGKMVWSGIKVGNLMIFPKSFLDQIQACEMAALK